jgi:hypothetical protein
MPITAAIKQYRNRPTEFPRAAAVHEISRSIDGSFTRTAIRMKDRQSQKIRQIRDALIAAGFLTLDEQAKVLGLSRSTTWTVLRGNHKGSGLSVGLINRMLAATQLPSLARATIEEYVEEKAAGLYGHGTIQRSRFIARLRLARGDVQAISHP